MIVLQKMALICLNLPWLELFTENHHRMIHHSLRLEKISSGEVLCIIEAMKVMNEIQSETAGEVIEILVEDGESVEYGQPLFKIGKG